MDFILIVNFWASPESDSHVCSRSYFYVWVSVSKTNFHRTRGHIVLFYSKFPCWSITMSSSIKNVIEGKWLFFSLNFLGSLNTYSNSIQLHMTYRKIFSCLVVKETSFKKKLLKNEIVLKMIVYTLGLLLKKWTVIVKIFPWN